MLKSAPALNNAESDNRTPLFPTFSQTQRVWQRTRTATLCLIATYEADRIGCVPVPCDHG